MGDEALLTEEIPQQEKFSLAVHATIDANQASHGMRHDDYKQYHGYCTRRLSRLRHAQPVRRDLVHSAAYVSGEKKKRNAYCPREQVTNSENALWVVVIGAERAWAHSCELKALMGSTTSGALAAEHEKSRSSPGKIRQHALRRLKRAKQLATQFQELCEQVCDERTVFEAKAYAGWMRGNWSLEVGDWKSACDEYSSAMSICRTLAESVEGDSLEMRDLFASRADNVLQPLLRYCQYEYRQVGGTVVEDATLQQSTYSAQKQSTKDGDVYFRGRDINIENKNLRVLLLKLDGLLANASEDEEKFLSVLSIYDDAIALVTADLKSIQSMKAGPAVNAKRAEMEGLLGYVKNGKLQLVMRRNENMVNALRAESPDAHADIAHLYDALLQEARQVCELSGTQQEEDEFILEANANVLRLRALRCYYAGQLYMESNKPVEGAALLKQAELLTSRATEEIAACEDMEYGDEYLEALDELAGNIGAALCRAKAQAYLMRTGASGGATVTYRPLLLRLDDFDGGTVLADVPPSPIPLPCKPAFFDVAWNYASAFPEDEIQNHIDEYVKQQSKGLLGWFRS